MNFIYLDNNATTPLLPAVWEAMRPFLCDVHGNPASAHSAGRRARQGLDDARERLARLLGADLDEVIFTSGATEANNLAVLGLVGEPPGHVIVSPVEHPSVAEPVRHLADIGFDITPLPVAPTGLIRAEALEDLRRADTRLVAVQLANHETGTLQPVRRLAAQVEGVPFHCDAVQAVGKVPVHFHDLGVTSLSLSAHKLHGPKGVGALLIRRGIRLKPLFFGGHQQQGRRPGTEPVALAVGLTTALELAHQEMETRRQHVLRLRARFFHCLHAVASPIVHNGAGAEGVPHTLNLSFPGCRSDVLLMNIDLAAVACSTGSACSSGSLLPSPVLQVMGLPPELLHSAMRFSLSSLLSEAEVEEAARRIGAVVSRLRRDQGTGDSFPI
jgi:cysteine desulfurase